jgi:hypothetical protein
MKIRTALASAALVATALLSTVSNGGHAYAATSHTGSVTHDQPLPAWFRAWHIRPGCLMVGSTHSGARGIVCRDGSAHVARRQAPHGARLDTRRMPPWFVWWTTDTASAIVIGGGNADTTLLVTSHHGVHVS